MEWLEEHLDYPYPTEEERDELWNITGLSRKQLRIWLINARKVNSMLNLGLLSCHQVVMSEI